MVMGFAMPGFPGALKTFGFQHYESDIEGKGYKKIVSIFFVTEPGPDVYM